MKDFRGMKRQRSRNRKPSGNQNNPNRAYESNGPEGTKVRGNAQTIYEKYQQLARDANSSGDRVLAENHLQHAEHYFRLIRQMQPQRPVSEFVQRDPFSNGYDDFDDDMDMEAGEAEAEAAIPGDGEQPTFEDRPRYEQRDNRDRDRNNNRNGNGNGNGNRDNNRDRDRNTRDRDRPQQSGEPREQRTFEPRSSAEPRIPVEPRVPVEARNAGEEGGEFEGGRRESRRERYERRRQQRLSEQEQNVNVAPETPVLNGSGYIASTEPLGVASAVRQPAPVQADLSFPAPTSEQPVVRDDAHLPAFLRQPTPLPAAVADATEAGEAEDAPAKPKRGRPRRTKVEAATEEA